LSISAHPRSAATPAVVLSLVLGRLPVGKGQNFGEVVQRRDLGVDRGDISAVDLEPVAQREHVGLVAAVQLADDVFFERACGIRRLLRNH